MDTRSPEELRERIADLLGYCLVDGELHDPEEYEESLGGVRWKCPDCGATAILTDYGRASELRWALGGEGLERNEENKGSTSVNADEEPSTDGEYSPDESEETQEKTELLENVKEVQESLTGEEETLEEGIEGISGENGSEAEEEDEEEKVEEEEEEDA